MAGFFEGFMGGLGGAANNMANRMSDLRTAGYNHMSDLYGKLAENYKTNPTLMNEYLRRAGAFQRAASNPFDRTAITEVKGYSNPGEPLQDWVNSNVDQGHMQLTGGPAPKDAKYGGSKATTGVSSLANIQPPQQPTQGFGGPKPEEYTYTPFGTQEHSPEFETWQKGQESYTTATAHNQAMADLLHQFPAVASDNLDDVLNSDRLKAGIGLPGSSWVEPKTVTMAENGGLGPPHTYLEHRGVIYDQTTRKRVQLKNPVQTTMFRQPMTTESSTTTNLRGDKHTVRKTGGVPYGIGPAASPQPNTGTISPPASLGTGQRQIVSPTGSNAATGTPRLPGPINTPEDLENLKNGDDLDKRVYQVLTDPMKWKGIRSQQERFDVGQRLATHGFGPDGPAVDSPALTNQLQLDTNSRNALVALNEIQGYVKTHPELVGPLQGRLQILANKLGSEDLVKFLSDASPEQTKQIVTGLPQGSAEALGYLTTRLRFLNLAEVRAVIGRAQGVATMYHTLVPAMLGLQFDPKLFKGHVEAFRSGLRDVLNETDRLLWGDNGPYPPRNKGLQSLLNGTPQVLHNGKQYKVSWDGGKTWQTQPLPPPR